MSLPGSQGRPLLKGRPTSARRFALAYGLAHGGKSLFWQTSELFFAFFLTETCGLAPRQMGAILGGSMVVSAGADLLAGFALSRRVQRPVAAGLWQLVGSLLSAAALLAFTSTALAPQGAPRVVLALVALIVFRSSYALVDVPQNALLALASPDDASRAALSSIRYMFGGLASVVVATAFATIVQARFTPAHPLNFMAFSMAIGCAAVGSAAGLWRALRRAGEPITPASRLQDARADRRRPDRFWPILLMMIMVTVATSVFSRLEPYFAVYGARSAQIGSPILIGVASGGMVSQPAWAALARYTSLRTAFVLACGALTLASAAFAALASQGFCFSLLGAGLYGAASGGVLMSLWAIAASASSARPTVSFGALTCASKMALALSAVLIGELLKSTDYRAPGVTRHYVLLAMTGAPAIAGLATLLTGWLTLPEPSGRCSGAQIARSA